MSSDPSNQLLNFFKQLVKQLDTKFTSLEKQLDTIETNLGNLRAFNERFQSQISTDLKNLKQSLSEQVSKDSTFLKDKISLDNLETPSTMQKPTPPTSPDFVSMRPPVGPPPLDQYRTVPSPYQTGFPEPKESIDNSPVTPSTNVVEIHPTTTSKGLESQYGGLKETPILEALKEEKLGDESYFEAQAKKQKVKKQTLMAYLKKLEKVIKTTLPIAQESLQAEDYLSFVDKGLTVVHGIIEFLFVAYRHEFPDASLDYYSKAKNLSGQGLFIIH